MHCHVMRKGVFSSLCLVTFELEYCLSQSRVGVWVRGGGLGVGRGEGVGVGAWGGGGGVCSLASDIAVYNVT